MFKIKEICSEKNLTIAELAAKMEIHPQSLSRIISTGNTRPATLEKIASILEVSVPELYGEQNGKMLIFLDETEWSIVKQITLVVPTPFGVQEVAYFMYKRPLTSDYKLNENTGNTDPFYNYPKQKDYPQDEIDTCILKAVQNKYPDSRLQNHLIITNTGRDEINYLMNPPSEEGNITLTPYVTPDRMKNNPGATYYRYEIPVNLYKTFNYDNFQKYFWFSFDVDLQSTIDSQYSTIQSL